VGLGADGLAHAYALDTPGLPTGAGKIVALVDAMSDSTVVADLAAYRAYYGLPALPQCGGANGVLPTEGGTACIGVVSQTGTATLPADDANWAGEISLDVDMVSAACPACSILLVEAKSASNANLEAAEKYAFAHADAVSNSFGGSESGSDSDTDYTKSGVLIAAASGDADWYNEINFDSSEADAQAWSVTYSPTAPNTPASMPTVLAVGGSNVMDAAGTLRAFTDNVWSDVVTNPAYPNLDGKAVYGGGSGCSTEFAAPSFQTSGPASTNACVTSGKRESVDVSGPSDYTKVPKVAGSGGILCYDTDDSGGGWQQVVGTSAASPFVTALLTRLGFAGEAISSIYAKSASFNDVTTGTNDLSGQCGTLSGTFPIDCNAGVGYDGPTGLGTPNAASLMGLDAGAAPPFDAGNSSGSTSEDGGGTSSGGTSSGGTSSGGTSSGGTSSGSTGDDAGGTSSGATSSGGTSSGGIGTSSGSSFEDAGGGGADGGGNFNSSGGNGSGGCAVGPANDDSPFVPALSLLGLGAVIALRVRRRK
jgi:MYXO-CTERM domain-containing protein